jgi:group I intron endonuclease
MIIYKIKNKLDGKLYIGQTAKTLEERWKEHRNMSSNCRYLKAAIKLYGKENFEVSIIAHCISETEMNYREAYYIKLFKTLAPNGYNLTKGGIRSEWSEVSRRKSSETHKRLAANNQNKGNFKKGQMATNLGIPHTTAAKIKMSKARKGQHNSPATEFKNGNHPKTEFKKGHVSPIKGKKLVTIDGKKRYQ